MCLPSLPAVLTKFAFLAPDDRSLHTGEFPGATTSLKLSWAAADPETINGDHPTPQECLSPDSALRAITTDTAWVVGREDENGSIRAGKRADFTVLESDPYQVCAPGAGQLKQNSSTASRVDLARQNGENARLSGEQHSPH
jgi:hypothetical protein